MRIISILLVALVATTWVQAQANDRQTPVCWDDYCQYSFLYPLISPYYTAFSNINGVTEVQNLGTLGAIITYNRTILGGEYDAAIQRWEDAQRVNYAMTLIAPDTLPPPLCLLDTNGQVYGYYSVNGAMVSIPNDTRCPR